MQNQGNKENVYKMSADLKKNIHIKKSKTIVIVIYIRKLSMACFEICMSSLFYVNKSKLFSAKLLRNNGREHPHFSAPYSYYFLSKVSNLVLTSDR